jgi:hypothetical protein
LASEIYKGIQQNALTGMDKTFSVSLQYLNLENLKKAGRIKVLVVSSMTVE